MFQVRGPFVITIIAVASALLGAATSSARAHHVVAERGVAAILPRTVAAVDCAAASFDLGERTGRWYLVTPSFEWQVLRRFSLFAALPFGRVASDAAVEYGIGDLSLSAKGTLVETAHGGLLLSAGLGLEVPTGSAAKGLGGGHVEVTPFVASSSALYSGTRLVLVTYGLASFRGALGDGHHDSSADGHSHQATQQDVHDHVLEPAAGSVLAPHGRREGYGRAMLAAIFSDVDVATGVEGAVAIGGGETGHLGWRSEVGYVVSNFLRFSGSFDFTVLGQERYGVRGSLGIARLF